MMINYRYYKNSSLLRTLARYSIFVWTWILKPKQLQFLKHNSDTQQLTTPRATNKLKIDNCQNCRICEQICPVQCIEIAQKWTINETDCISCGRCIQTCPYQYLEYVQNHNLKKSS